MPKKLILVLIVACITLFACSFSGNAQESICLIPKGFSGAVFIVFDQADGVAPTIEESRYVYRIPEDGILRTTKKVNFRIEKNEFFYTDAEGVRNEIKYLYPGGDAWRDKDYTFDKIDATKEEIYVFSDEMGGGADKDGKEVRFRRFLVGKAKDKRELHLEAEKKIAKAIRGIEIWNRH